MSRKNKTLRAFLHQNQNPTIKQTWDTAWKRAQKIFHTRSMQDMEKQIAELQAELARERQRRFDGNEQASREHREDVAWLIVLLEHAQCQNCDGSGARYDNYGEPEQCQWCHERAEALDTYRKPQEKDSDAVNKTQHGIRK